MPRKRKINFRLHHIVPALALVIIAGSLAFYGSTQLRPSSADTAAYYSCDQDPSEKPNGSTCTHVTTYDITQGTWNPPYCGGGEVQSGSTCTSTYHGCTYQFDTDSTPSDYGSQGAGDDLYLHCATYIHKLDTTQLSNGLYSRCSSYLAWYRGYAGLGSSGYGCYNATVVNCGSDTRQSSNTDVCTRTHNVYPGYYSCNNGDTQNGTTCSRTTTYNATYHPATTTSTSGTSSSSGGTGSTSGSTTKKATTSTKSTSTTVTITPVAPPSAPTDLRADVVSSKVVELSWSAGQAAAGVKNYEIQRSPDGTTWSSLGVASGTGYNDTTTEFSQTYYYRVREVDNNGAPSDYASVQVSTEKFASSGSTITSEDKLVMVHIPAGAFDREVSCSVIQPDGDQPEVAGKTLLLGSYRVLCIDDNGTTIDSFKKPLNVTMDLSGASSGFGGFQAQLYGDSNASAASEAKFDERNRMLSFQLDASKSFAAYGTKQKSAAAVIFKTFMLLVLLASAVFGGLYLRRYWATRTALAVASGETATPDAANIFEQAALKPSCTHLNMAQKVQPQTAGCAECTLEHKHWKALRICLTCGHVGCSDDSDEQHARKHFEQTGHPLIYEYGNPAGDTIGWCYIDQTYI